MALTHCTLWDRGTDCVLLLGGCLSDLFDVFYYYCDAFLSVGYDTQRKKKRIRKETRRILLARKAGLHTGYSLSLASGFRAGGSRKQYIIIIDMIKVYFSNTVAGDVLVLLVI